MRRLRRNGLCYSVDGGPYTQENSQSLKDKTHDSICMRYTEWPTSDRKWAGGCQGLQD